MSIQDAVEFIVGELKAGTFPGAALRVARRNELLFNGCWGTYCSTTRRDNPLDADVAFMLYSFSKGISATAIVIAHQRGLIDYDAPLRTYIPAYCGGWKDLTTIRHLLTHAAGIPNCPLGPVVSPGEWQAAVDTCCAETVAWEPGSRTEYHAISAMFLAAEATRRAMDRPTWEAVCQDLLFHPLGAHSLTFRVPEPVGVALTPQPQDLPAALNSSNFKVLGHPGGGCFGRIEDIIRVLQLHLNNGLWNGQVLIQENELREMHRIQYETQIANAQAAGTTRVHSPWGLGWMIRREPGVEHWFGLGHSTSPRTFGHAGIDTVIGVGEPERQVAMAFLTTNSPNPSGPNTTRIRNTVTDLVMAEFS